MRRGQVAAAIAGHAIGRRPAARRVLVVTTVATAVAVFRANAVVVADRNRMARAELETGAPAVVTVDSPSAPALIAAADALEEHDIAAAPVAMIRPRDRGAAATMATDPQRLLEVAHPDTVRGLDVATLALPDQVPIVLPAGSVTGTVSRDFVISTGDVAPTPGRGPDHAAGRQALGRPRHPRSPPRGHPARRRAALLLRRVPTRRTAREHLRIRRGGGQGERHRDRTRRRRDGAAGDR
uniref:Uncharacterized protein n=2 Tax=Janibacter limosus TaxID=53458 RepID=A0AC61U3F4_9MICO|nr:hypothetical protein [Janibacter limosus]